GRRSPGAPISGRSDRRSPLLVLARVPGRLLAEVEGGQQGAVLVVQLDALQARVRPLALRVLRLRDHHDVLVDRPAQRDLRGGDAVLAGDAPEGELVAEPLATAQRAPGLGDDAVLAVEGDGLRPRQRGGELDLVDLGGHARSEEHTSELQSRSRPAALPISWSIAQRSESCEAETPCSRATRRRANWSPSPSRPPSGPQAWVTMPCSRWKATASARGSAGESWIWLTSGVTPVASISSCSCSGRKFETPMCSARPSSLRSIRVRQVSRARPREGFGQWISTRAARSRPSRRSEPRKPSRAASRPWSPPAIFVVTSAWSGSTPLSRRPW